MNSTTRSMYQSISHKLRHPLQQNYLEVKEPSKDISSVPPIRCYINQDNKNVVYVIIMKQLIKHLFFKCQHANVIWRVVNIATGLTPWKLIVHMLGN